MLEVGIRHGAGRIDILVAGSDLHGYEIKSDRDSLRRLSRQIPLFSSVLERMTLVVGVSHEETVRRVIPPWWGLVVACGGGPFCLRKASVEA